MHHLHSESKKTCHYTFVDNLYKCWPIFKIVSLLYSPRNLQQNSCHVACHTLDVSLHYLRNLKFKIQPFSVTAITNPTWKINIVLFNVIKVHWVTMVTISGLWSHTQKSSQNCIYELAVTKKETGCTRASAADTFDLRQVNNPWVCPSGANGPEQTWFWSMLEWRSVMHTTVRCFWFKS